ncbi:hypothetical protein QOZ94_002454 [Xanthobacter agilis]|uniref:Uncharacterized protein n=1 Tax=Xanthobacter agilis TaxID=47492 RepID=A0ABU0LET0_XANAG|nr:hypothetical protein [Xanthobacter agilis]
MPKEIASRTRAGENLADLLVSAAQRTAGASLFKVEAKAEGLHAALESLPPAPSGKVNNRRASLTDSKRSRQEEAPCLGAHLCKSGVPGPVDGAVKDKLKAQVQDNGGTMVC